ncbi:MAG: UDP-N-acetyl glucosamine 2-epimerase, partial [Promicromonosporaceae bacterium]|nr:UDP-N-acetyl glucosamine 2-epimerase [Promicromonosporaceae bacterium]
DHPRVHLTEPLGYLEFMGLLRGAALVLTDSGGVQEETTIFGVPCLTLRENTERPVTITHGTNRLVRPDNAVEAAREALHNPAGAIDRPPLWDGRAGERIANVLVLRYGLGSASPRMAEAGNDEARGER